MALQNMGVGAEGLLAGASQLNAPAEEFGNDSRVEALWAMKAMEHAEVYFNILCSVDPKTIPRLSARDADISEKFNESFPDLNLRKLTESDLKSGNNKEKWRKFCDEFKDLDDFSFATLLRLDSDKDYSEENSIIVTKVQFYAIELARNKQGHNDEIRNNFKPVPRSARPKVQTNGQSPAMSEVEAELKEILCGRHPMLQQ